MQMKNQNFRTLNEKRSGNRTLAARKLKTLFLRKKGRGKEQ
jgi:hypothetical protein